MRPFPAAVALLLLATPATAAELRATTTLTDGVVRLCDLFDDAGPLAGRVLGPGPAPGARIVVEAAQLAAIARQFGVAWRPASPGERAVLERPGKPLRREEAILALQRALAQQGASPDAEIELPGFVPPLLPMEARAEASIDQLDYDAPSGRFTAQMTIAGEGMSPARLRVAGRVVETLEVPVATHRLLPGSVLRADDLRLARVRAGLIRPDAIRRLDQAVGMELRHQEGEGQPLALSDLTRAALVKKNQAVTLELESGGVSLTAQAEAIDAGALGDRIRVLNTSSHAVLEAEVSGNGHARVTPGTMPLLPGQPGALPAGVLPQVAQR